jgi:hypothetical protein
MLLLIQWLDGDSGGKIIGDEQSGAGGWCGHSTHLRRTAPLYKPVHSTPATINPVGYT